MEVPNSCLFQALERSPAYFLNQFSINNSATALSLPVFLLDLGLLPVTQIHPLNTLYIASEGGASGERNTVGEVLSLCLGYTQTCCLPLLCLPFPHLLTLTLAFGPQFHLMNSALDEALEYDLEHLLYLSMFL